MSTILRFLLAVMSLLISPALQGGLREEIGTKLIVHFHGEHANESARQLIQENHVGGFMFFSWANGLQNRQQVFQLCSSLQALSRQPLIFAVDQEGGRVTHLKGEFTVPPSPRTLSPDSVFFYAQTVAREMKEVGIGLNFAPLLDLVKDSAFSPLGLRSYGGDTQRVIDCGRAALLAMRQEGVEGCVKHFPGLGSIGLDTHHHLPLLNKTLEELEREDLVPFIALLPETRYLMVGHVIVPALDVDCPASLSKKVINDYLRGVLGYRGLVVSDSLVMRGAIQHAGSIEEAAWQALQAGCDYIILGGKVGETELQPDDIGRILDYLVAKTQDVSIVTDTDH